MAAWVDYRGSATGGTWSGASYLSRYIIPVATAQPISIQPAAVAASTGVNPTETQYSIWGHPIPLYVFGIGRIGGELISGPVQENGMVYGGVSFGVAADPTGIRTLTEVAFDSEVIWEGSQVGDGTLDPAGFSTEPFTCRFYSGSLTQSADPLETARYGAEANAYRPQTMLFIDGLPLAATKFKKFPYVACKFSDSSGMDVNLGEAFERIAYSPWVGLTPDQFETSGITDGLPDGGLIIVEQDDFLSLIQRFGRFYPTWDILQTDKLRIVDRGSNLVADITLNKERLMGSIIVNRLGDDGVRKDLELSTIDPGADYTIVPSVALLPRDPVAVTSSVGKDSEYLPAIMDSFTRASMVTFAKYHEEARRNTISGTAMAYGLEMEPGDLVAIRDLGDDFNDEVFKVKETLHGANYAVEFTAEAILNCLIPPVEYPLVCVNSGHADLFLARTSGLDATHIAAYTALLNGLDADNLACKFDLLHIYATQDSATALLNLVGNNYSGIIRGAPIFTADRGFTGIDGSTSDYIDTRFNPATATAPKYLKGDAHLSVWQVNDVASDGPSFGSSEAPTVFTDHFDLAYIVTKLVGTGYQILSLNGLLAQSLYGVVRANSDGHWMVSRPSDGFGSAYYNGALTFGITSTSEIPNFNLYSLAGNMAGTALGSAGQVAMVSAGANLDATETANFYGHIRTYMTAVGVP